MLKNIKRILIRFKDSIYSGSINPKGKQERLNLIFRSLVLHLHPPLINKKVLKFNHTFGLGGMAIILICMQFITGLLLRFYYEPFAGKAYDSILSLQSNVFFGQFIRNLHYWAAVFLIVITILHLLRVFFSGAFHGKRQFNWVLGVILLHLVLFSNFTGYLLPWDQLSYWAVTVSTSMLDYFPLIGGFIKGLLIGGDEIGTPTLIIFYNLHTGILPILMILIMAFHFWRVRKSGGVIIPQNDSEDELTQIARFIANISPDIPWHISRFHPDYKMTDKEMTPLETLHMAYDIGKKAGLNYIYVGNIMGNKYESTHCPSCDKIVIERLGYRIIINNLEKNKCECGKEIKGVF